MTINPYFNEFKNTNEQDLLNSLTREDIQIHGMSLKYIPRTIVVKDDILGEVTQSNFSNAYDLEFYLENTDTFDGEDLLSTFGIDLKTAFSFIVNKERFENEVTAYEPDVLRPQEGDLLYVPMNSSIYEITNVKKWENYFQFQKRFTWKIMAELYTEDGDTFTTGEDSIDGSIEDFQDDDHQVNQGTSSEQEIEDDIVNNDWLDSSESNPFGEILD